MDKGGILFIFTIIIGFCFIFNNSIPRKYTKLEESFGGFMKRSLVRFEYEKSPLHTILYGRTGTGKHIFLDNISNYISKAASQIKIKI